VRRILSFGLGLGVGLGVGLVLGGNVVRRLDAAQQRFAPDRLGVLAATWVEAARSRVAGVAAGRGRAGKDPFDARLGEVVEHPTARRASQGDAWTR
jgi:hypothetical protein